MILDWHYGLGDAIICNGLVRELAKRYDRLVLPCHARNLSNVSRMFSDLRNVEVRIVDPPRYYPEEPVLHIGDNVAAWDGGQRGFDRAFYDLAAVPFECRWSSFYVPNIPPMFTRLNLPLIFDRGSDGEHPLGIEGVRMEHYPLIPNVIPIISEAEEIHCIDSAPIHLVESVPTRGHLFFHLNARSGGHNTSEGWAKEPAFMLRKHWRIIE